MSDRPELDIHQQTAFDDDGQLEVTESSVETSLEDFGAGVDRRDRDSRIDRPERVSSASMIDLKLHVLRRAINLICLRKQPTTSRRLLATPQCSVCSTSNYCRSTFRRFGDIRSES